MFFYLSKIFAALFLPVTLFFLFLLWVFTRHLRGRMRNACLGAWGVAWFCSTSFGSGLIMRPLENQFPALGVREIAKADAVVVLGGMIDANTRRGGRPEFHDSVDRLTAALEILLHGKADYLLVSGGSGLMFQGGLKEAEFLKSYLAQLGLPQEKILSEAVSRNTRENAAQSALILAEKKLRRIVLVTSAFHMPRSLACFRKMGIDALPYPVDFKASDRSVFPESFFPSAQGIDDFSMAVRELVGLLAYRLAGYT